MKYFYLFLFSIILTSCGTANLASYSNKYIDEDGFHTVTYEETEKVVKDDSDLKSMKSSFMYSLVWGESNCNVAVETTTYSSFENDISIDEQDNSVAVKSVTKSKTNAKKDRIVKSKDDVASSAGKISQKILSMIFYIHDKLSLENLLWKKK